MPGTLTAHGAWPRPFRGQREGARVEAPNPARRRRCRCPQAISTSSRFGVVSFAQSRGPGAFMLNAVCTQRVGVILAIAGALFMACCPARAQAPPSNDNFDLAIGLAGHRGSVTSTNVGSTTESGEPTHGSSSSGGSVWYRWTAPVTARVSFDTRGSEFDTTLAVYSGTSLGGLSKIVENDDHAWADACCVQSRVIFNAEQGQAYAIAVAGWNGGTGTFRLRWEIPPNDSFSNAEALQGIAASATGGNIDATGEAGEPLHAGISADASVWWHWRAPASGRTQVDTVGSNYDTTLAVYSGSSLAALTQIAANDDAVGAQSRVAFDAAGGTLYWIAVDGYLSSRGNITLNLSTDVGVPPEIASQPAAPAIVALPEALVGALALGRVDFIATGGSGAATTAIDCSSSDGIRIAASPSSDPGGTFHSTVVAAGEQPPGLVIGATLADSHFTGSVLCTVHPLGQASYTLAFTVAVPEGRQPEVSLAINGTCADFQPYQGGAAITLSWDSAGMDSCVASSNPAAPAWSGNRLIRGSQSVSIPPLPGTATFTLQCSGPAGTRSDSISVDVTVPTAPTITTLGPLRDVFGLVEFHQHACIVHTDGGVSCWGSNDFGQLGNGNTFNQPLPTRVLGVGSGARQVSGRRSHTCAAMDTGAIRCWGHNNAGQLGDGTQSDRLTASDVIGLGGPATSVATGNGHTCAVLNGGALRCWGNNSSGQLGLGDTQFRTVPTPVSGLDNVRQASGSLNHTCAVTYAGAAYCWGNNDWGQLGDGSTTQRLVPTPVQGLDSGVLAISAGGGRFEFAHTCALRADGQVLCWGSNQRGQLGDGSFTGNTVPRPVLGLTGAIGISAGTEHSCAMTQGGPRCWGSNLNGELGNLGSVDSNSPIGVSVLGNTIATLTAGRYGSCAKAEDSTLSCWGANDLGSLGDNTFISRRFASPVLTRMTTIGAIDVVTPTGNGASRAPAVTDSGRFVVFESASTNLIEGSTGPEAVGIYIRDRTRPFCSPGGLRRVSEDAFGNPIIGDAIEPSVSEDGALVAFVAPSAGIVRLSGESTKQAENRRKTNHHLICLRQMLTGGLQCIDGVPANSGGRGSTPRMPANGRRVVWATNQGLGSTGTQIASVSISLGNDGRLQFGPPECLTCFGVNKDGQAVLGEPASGPSTAPALSRSGESLAFETQATNLNLESGSSLSRVKCPGANSRVSLRNLLTGRINEVSTPAPGGACGSPGQGCTSPSISSSGAALAMQCNQPLAPGQADTGQWNVFHWRGGTLRRVSARPDGFEPGGDSVAPSISGDGRVVGFSSNSFGLDGAVFSGPTADVEKAIDEIRRGQSVASAHGADAVLWPGGETPTSAEHLPSDTQDPTLAAASWLPERKGTDQMDVHLWDEVFGTRRLATNASGESLLGSSMRSALTYNGLDVVLESDAPNFVPQDTNGATDVFGRSNPALLLVVFRSGFD